LPQAEATLAIAITAEELGIIDVVVVDGVIIVIVVTCLLGPLLTSWLGKGMARESKAAAAQREAAADHGDEEEARAPAMHERSDKP
ncbi:MAG: hypothetical protein ACNA7W_21990, partial [Pseudomonadales bacterium]